MKDAMKRIGAVWVVAAVLSLAVAGGSLAERYSFGVNETESLPNWAFITDHESRRPDRGALVDFIAPENSYYPAGARFVKIVYGVPGDRVEIRGRDFYVAGRFVGRAKERSARGDLADIGPEGIIPADHYFVGTPHVDGFDSRYAAIGWIPRSAIVGLVRPIL